MGLIADLKQAQRKTNEANIFALKVLNYTINKELHKCKYKSQLKFVHELNVHQAIELYVGRNASNDSQDI